MVCLYTNRLWFGRTRNCTNEDRKKRLHGSAAQMPRACMRVCVCLAMVVALRTGSEQLTWQINAALGYKYQFTGMETVFSSLKCGWFAALVDRLAKWSISDWLNWIAPYTYIDSRLHGVSLELAKFGWMCLLACFMCFARSRVWSMARKCIEADDLGQFFTLFVIMIGMFEDRLAN